MFILRLSRGLAPSYTSDLFITTYEGGHSLRSSGRALQVVPRTSLVTKGDPVFAVKAPEVCSTLPELRLARSVASFKPLLKAQLYREAFLQCAFMSCYIAVPSLPVSSQLNFYFHCLRFLFICSFSLFFLILFL